MFSQILHLYINYSVNISPVQLEKSRFMKDYLFNKRRLNKTATLLSAIIIVTTKLTLK